MQQAVVRIKNAVETLGTGFFIGNDGTLLTCFHVIGNIQTGELERSITIVTFDDQEYPAECKDFSSDPNRLDMAVLQLKEGKLPPGAVVLPFGTWHDISAPEISCTFITFGYRKPANYNGFHAQGEIRGYTSDSRNGKRSLLQIAPQPDGAQEFRRGMSGAPVCHKESGQVIGMITEGIRANEEIKEIIKKENMCFAEPIEIIAQECKPIQKRLRDDSILYQLKSIFVVDSLFREVFIRKFYRDIPFLGLSDYDKIGIDPFQELFQFLRKNNGVDSFLSWLEARHKNIYDRIDLPPNYCFFNFVNRKYECEKACGDYSAQYIIFDAPTKYGKTELLKAIELKCIKKQWYCIYTETPSSVSSLELAQIIKKEAKIDTVLSNPTLHDIGTLIACKYEGKKLLILIDNLERLSDENVAPFLNEFIPAMQNVLPDVRVQMAGQYISATWDRKGKKKIPLTVCSLSPFKFRCVRETVELRLPDLDETALDLCAAYLMHMTGGHPGLMAQIIDTMPQVEEEQFAVFQDRYKNEILHAANTVRESIPAPLQGVLDGLSIFRRYNRRLLKKIIQLNLIEWDGDVFGLENELLSNYLAKRENGFIHDEIVRHLLAVRLRLEDNKKQFFSLCEKARDIYKEDLQNAVSSPEIIVIEGLYQELQLGCCNEAAEREKLRDIFFSNDGILHQYLTLLAKQPDHADSFPNLIDRLQDKEIEWEFRFTVNFCLRGEQYSDAPYEKLCQQVKSFAEELEERSNA